MFVSCRSSQHKTNIEKRNIPIELQDGDVAFRRGVGFMSQIVLAASNPDSYSHVGVVCRVNDAWCVIHSVPYEGESIDDDKIYCEGVEEFFATHKASAGAIYRLRGIDSMECREVLNYALCHLTQETPFDHEYDLEDEEHQYCSELVWRSFLEIGVDITEGRRTTLVAQRQYIMPCDIERCSQLTQLFQF